MTITITDDPRGAGLAKAIKARWVPAQSGWAMRKGERARWQRLYDAGFSGRRYNGQAWFTLPDVNTRYNYWKALEYAREFAKQHEERRA